MDLKPEKIRLITNIVYFAIGCVLVAALAVFCMLISIKSDDDAVRESEVETQEDTQETTPADARVQSVPKKYYVIEENDKICIYEVRQSENVFYDYGAVDKNLMSEEMKLELKKGINFNSEPELYEFLQTYSS